MTDGLRVAIHWISPTTYLRACVDALVASNPGAEVALTFTAVNDRDTDYDESHVMPARCSIAVLDSRNDFAPLRRFRDDPFALHIFSGRNIPAYRRLAHSLSGRAKRAFVTDHPIIPGKKLIARILWFRTVGRDYFDYAFVTGDRQAAHAFALGFHPADVWIGAYAAALPRQLPTTAKRDAFVFVGRLVKEKGVSQLAEGYALYRERVGAAAWSLVVIGIGPLASELARIDGVSMRGFVDPPQVWTEMLAARAMVLPSLFEPWGVVLHEAALACLPLVASAQCGAGGHLLRDGWNGWILPAVTPGAIAEMLCGVHESTDLLGEMGQRSGILARQFTPEQWAATVLRMARR